MQTRAAWHRPRHEAVIDGDRRMTYRGLNEEVNRLSHALLAADYKRGDDLALASGQLSHAGSVDLPVPDVPVGDMNDAGHLLPTGETGEIVYRGPHAMEGYLRNPDATAEAFAHGWFHSGDVGHLDADGLLSFADRKKELIKSGGENIASIEVDKALHEVEPRLQEVVVGLPHERWSEAVAAIVTPKSRVVLDEKDLIAAARTRLSGFKVPKAVLFTSAIPRTGTARCRRMYCTRSTATPSTIDASRSVAGQSLSANNFRPQRPTVRFWAHQPGAHLMYGGMLYGTLDTAG
ncbi:AMP-binding protein [Mycobacterium sp. NPDC006124]|uniref:AMP-binding protein n=1 Tax=Mycobacterium sp. NPDC006124 TaxID=3156729 RepID=UPI0033B664DE